MNHTRSILHRHRWRKRVLEPGQCNLRRKPAKARNKVLLPAHRHLVAVKNMSPDSCHYARDSHPGPDHDGAQDNGGTNVQRYLLAISRASSPRTREPSHAGTATSIFAPPTNAHCCYCRQTHKMLAAVPHLAAKGESGTSHSLMIALADLMNKILRTYRSDPPRDVLRARVAPCSRRPRIGSRCCSRCRSWRCWRRTRPGDPAGGLILGRSFGAPLPPSFMGQGARCGRAAALAWN